MTVILSGSTRIFQQVMLFFWPISVDTLPIFITSFDPIAISLYYQNGCYNEFVPMGPGSSSDYQLLMDESKTSIG
jgi:hypothetical protein